MIRAGDPKVADQETPKGVGKEAAEDARLEAMLYVTKKPFMKMGWS